MALLNQDKLEPARRAFQDASRDERSRKAATQWLAFVDSEIKRQQLLEQELPDMEPRERDELLKALEDDAASN
jgi:hypothetical protein